jgi:hypothetical protein
MTLSDPGVLQLPDRLEGMRTFDRGLDRAAAKREQGG